MRATKEAWHCMGLVLDGKWIKPCPERRVSPDCEYCPRHLNDKVEELEREIDRLKKHAVMGMLARGEKGKE